MSGFTGEQVEAERCNLPHTTDVFPPQKRCNGFNPDHLPENTALSYFDNNL